MVANATHQIFAPVIDQCKKNKNQKPNCTVSGKCSNPVSSPQYNQLYKGKWYYLPVHLPLLKLHSTDQFIDNGQFFWFVFFCFALQF